MLINEFRGEYSFLSNFYPCTIKIGEHVFNSVEAAFQAMKCPARMKEFVGLGPKEAKALGRKVELREGWNEKRNFFMEILVAEKFSNPILRSKLMSTGESCLIEGNNHGDRYWGMVQGEGQNKLGHILMKLRDKLSFEEGNYSRNIETKTAEVVKTEKEVADMKSVCFTGHRPDKLGGYDYYSPKNIAIAVTLRNTVIELYNKGYTHFICGGALGIDQLAFLVCEKLKRQGYALTTELALPVKELDKVWQKASKELHAACLTKADKITHVDDFDEYNPSHYVGYAAWKMQKRNEYMVDKADVVVAYWDGSKGGTGNCVEYTNSRNKTLINIYGKEVK